MVLLNRLGKLPLSLLHETGLNRLNKLSSRLDEPAIVHLARVGGVGGSIAEASESGVWHHVVSDLQDLLVPLHLPLACKEDHDSHAGKGQEKRYQGQENDDPYLHFEVLI